MGKNRRSRLQGWAPILRDSKKQERLKPSSPKWEVPMLLATTHSLVRKKAGNLLPGEGSSPFMQRGS